MAQGPETTTIALIGSFRQHFDEILRVMSAFETAGWRIASPARSRILKQGVEFVRLSSDPLDAKDSLVQSLAMTKILAADLVYVVAPKGYIGKTTCYEIGRLIQAQRPIYFSEEPKDLPVEVHPDRILSTDELIMSSKIRCWTSLHSEYESETAMLEKGILIESN